MAFSVATPATFRKETVKRVISYSEDVFSLVMPAGLITAYVTLWCGAPIYAPVLRKKGIYLYK